MKDKYGKKFVLIYGFGYSGSGAVLDMLKEYQHVKINKAFFSIIKDPYGIIDLENSLVNNWDFVKSSIALDDFRWLCKKCAQGSKNYLKPSGLDLSSKINKNFVEISNDFCDSLVTFRYKCWNEITDFKSQYFANILNRLIRVLNRRLHLPVDVKDQMSFISITKEVFYEKTQDYINKLFGNYSDEDWVVLDHHPLPVQFGDKLNCYFGENAKMIVVDRDPRGIYFDLVTHNNRLGQELAKKNDWKLYCEWHKALRRNLPKNDNILYLKFEDLIFNYEQKEKEIAEFLGLDLSWHIDKFSHFDPKVSIKNVNLWEKSSEKIPPKVFENIKTELNL